VDAPLLLADVQRVVDVLIEQQGTERSCLSPVISISSTAEHRCCHASVCRGTAHPRGINHAVEQVNSGFDIDTPHSKASITKGMR
jgi:hypothetical protein